MIVVVDNTQGNTRATYLPQLLAYLQKHRIRYRIVRSLSDPLPKKIDKIILSGSRVMITPFSLRTHRDLFLLNYHVLQNVALPRRIPVLGICFGCQWINVFFGGDLAKLDATLCTRLPLSHYSIRDAQFCCNYVLDNVPTVLKTLASSASEGRVFPCMIQHQEYPIVGTLFHPEAHEETHPVLTEFLRC